MNLRDDSYINGIATNRIDRNNYHLRRTGMKLSKTYSCHRSQEQAISDAWEGHMSSIDDVDEAMQFLFDNLAKFIQDEDTNDIDYHYVNGVTAFKAYKMIRHKYPTATAGEIEMLYRLEWQSDTN